MVDTSKILKYLKIKQNPNLAILTYLENLDKQVKIFLEAKIAEIEAKFESKYSTELKEILEKVRNELRQEIPNYEILLDKIKGRDGRDVTPEEVVNVLITNAQFIELTKAKDGLTPTRAELLSLIQPLIPVISDERLISLIQPLIPQPKDGVTPIAGIDYPTNQEFTEMIQKLLPSEDKTFKEEIKKLIKNLTDEVKKLKEKSSEKVLGGYIHGGGDTVQAGSGISISVSNGKKVITATGSAGTPVYGEEVSGSGTSWTLANTPIDTVRLFANGQRLKLTTDYTITGTSIATVSSWSAGEILADYSY